MLETPELEKIFSSNKNSPLFPILANRYYQNKLYKYSVKVCNLGLNEDPGNLEGLYVLSKTLLMQGRVILAETTLKKILKKCPHHLYSSLLLIHVYKKLKRNQNTIKAQVKKMYQFYPLHHQIIKYYEQYCASSEVAVKSDDSTQHIKAKSLQFNYNAQLATITMYKLLYSQKEYEEALSILKVLATKPKHKKFAKSELEKINKKLDRS